jgi:hypothetical protein
MKLRQDHGSFHPDHGQSATSCILPSTWYSSRTHHHRRITGNVEMVPYDVHTAKQISCAPAPAWKRDTKEPITTVPGTMSIEEACTVSVFQIDGEPPLSLTSSYYSSSRREELPIYEYDKTRQRIYLYIRKDETTDLPIYVIVRK